MTAIAIVLLVLGCFFSTLQCAALMKRFWKWTLIGVASVALAIALTVLVIAVRESRDEPQKTTEIHGPWSTIVKPEYYGADGRKIAKPEKDVISLVERIDQAFGRVK